MIARGHIGEKLNSHAVVIARMLSLYESVPGNALIRIEAKYPVELQLFARRLQQESAMSTLSNPARLYQPLPRLGKKNPRRKATLGHMRPPVRRQPRTPQVHYRTWTPVQAWTKPPRTALQKR
jgi:hypothetical protein